MRDLLNGMKCSINRRSFMKKGLTAAGAAVMGAGMSANGLPVIGHEGREERSGTLTKGDAAILRILAAAEILETDICVQYNELRGIHDNEIPRRRGSAPNTPAIQYP